MTLNLYTVSSYAKFRLLLHRININIDNRYTCTIRIVHVVMYNAYCIR